MDEHTSGMYELEYPAPDVSSDKPTTLIVALEGYADAGQAIDASASYLLSALDHRLLAQFDNDELIDFRSRRPATVIEDCEVKSVEPVDLALHVVRDTDGKPFLLLAGPEPDMRWEGFTQAVTELVDRFGVDQTICLYSAAMGVPHTRPMVVTAHGNTKELTDGHVHIDSRLVLPGSAALMIEHQLGKKGKKVAGYTAHVPHYIAGNEYPEATVKLLRAVARAGGLSLPLSSLVGDAQRVHEELAEFTEGNQDIAQVVGMLETQYDEELAKYRDKHPDSPIPGEATLPSAEELGEEFEEFLQGLHHAPDDLLPPKDSLSAPDAGHSLPEVTEPRTDDSPDTTPPPADGAGDDDPSSGFGDDNDDPPRRKWFFGLF